MVQRARQTLLRAGEGGANRREEGEGGRDGEGDRYPNETNREQGEVNAAGGGEIGIQGGGDREAKEEGEGEADQADHQRFRGQ